MSGEPTSLLRRWVDEVYNDGRLEVLDVMCPFDCVFHGPKDLTITGREAIRRYIALIRHSSPDVKIRIGEQVETGDLLSTRFLIEGTVSEKDANGRAQVRAVSLEVLNVIRVSDGMIVESWQDYNDTDAMRRVADALLETYDTK